MFLNDLYNKLFTKPVPGKVNYKNFVNEQQQYRYTQDLRDYKSALMSAESMYSPNRQLLYNIYNNVIMDTHLSSVSESRKIKSLAHPFKITRNGVDDDKATALFTNKKWFQDFLEYAHESVMYGYSLIQIDGIDNNKVAAVKLVPRQHVKPLNHLVVAYPGDTSGIDYTMNPYADWYVGVGKERDLGLLAKVAPLVLLKQNAVANWAQFNEVFGMPLRVGKTNLSDTDRATAMFNALRDMSSAAFAVLDKDDEITLTESIKSDGKVFENFLRWIDEQISKVLLGGTMNTDNGSSRAQGEVHERLADTYSEFDLRNLSFVVNDSLIPLLIRQGYDLTNCTFQFYEVEDTAALFDMSVKLLQAGYGVDEKWIEAKFNIPVTAKAVVVPTNQDTANFPKPA